MPVFCPDDLRDCGGNRHRCGDINALEFEGDKEQEDGK
jgi:hypothetical protein